jgi:hypothetical protein
MLHRIFSLKLHSNGILGFSNSGDNGAVFRFVHQVRILSMYLFTCEVEFICKINGFLDKNINSASSRLFLNSVSNS